MMKNVVIPVLSILALCLTPIAAMASPPSIHVHGSIQILQTTHLKCANHMCSGAVKIRLQPTSKGRTKKLLDSLDREMGVPAGTAVGQESRFDCILKSHSQSSSCYIKTKDAPLRFIINRPRQ
jgi:hypothetical protein